MSHTGERERERTTDGGRCAPHQCPRGNEKRKKPKWMGGFVTGPAFQNSCLTQVSSAAFLRTKPLQQWVCWSCILPCCTVDVCAGRRRAIVLGRGVRVYVRARAGVCMCIGVCVLGYFFPITLGVSSSPYSTHCRGVRARVYIGAWGRGVQHACTRVMLNPPLLC